MAYEIGVKSSFWPKQFLPITKYDILNLVFTDSGVSSSGDFMNTSVRTSRDQHLPPVGFSVLLSLPYYTLYKMQK